MTSSHDCGKQYCVIDTGALVNLCRVELGAKRAIEWVLDDFCVLIPQLVFNEGKIYLSDDADERRLYFDDVQSLVQKIEEIAEIALDELIDHLPPPMKSRVDAGEKAAAAFGFEISRRYRQYILMVTNDFKATEPLQVVFSNAQIGFLRDAYDLLVFVASRHPNDLPLRTLEVALRDLNSMVRDPNISRDVPSTPDEVLAKHLQLLNKFPDTFGPM